MMRLTVGMKLGLGIGLLCGLFAITGLVSNTQTRLLDQRVREMTEVDEPTSVAAFEVEINLIGTGFALLGYLHDRDPRHLERIREDTKDFERNQRQYNRLAETQKGKDLGDKVDRGFARFREMAGELIRIEDEQTRKTDVLLDNLDKMDALLDEKIQASIRPDDPDAYEKLQAALEMEINTNGIAKGLGNFLRTHAPQYEERVRKDEQDFKDYLSRYQRLPLSSLEKEWAAEVSRLFGHSVTLVREIIALDKQKERGLAEFVRIRRELDTVLDEEIQVLTHKDLHEAKEAVHNTVTRTNTVNALLLLGGLAFGSLAAVVAARSVTKPVDQLLSVTRAIA